MSRTKQEIINESNAMADNHKKIDVDGNGVWCVDFTKKIMQFVGVPSWNKARGDANNIVQSLIADGVANSGSGQLTIKSVNSTNTKAGKKAGHIWVEINGWIYEQTSSTGVIKSQGSRKADHICNLDKWVKADAKPIQKSVVKKTIYGSGYVKQDDVIGRVSKFLRDNFPAYTPAEALGNIAGPNFTKALKKFQENCKITVDGNFTIGGETWNKLKEHGFGG